jgi:hypothetical protein
MASSDVQMIVSGSSDHVCAISRVQRIRMDLALLDCSHLRPTSGMILTGHAHVVEAVDYMVFRRIGGAFERSARRI